MDLLSKVNIRKCILNKRQLCDSETSMKWNKSIFTKLVNSEFYKKSTVIFIFVSFEDEVDTHQIINRAISDGKIICVPRIQSKATGIEIFKINSLTELRPGYYGILEPLERCPEVDSKNIDLIIMPGVAFDRHGGRVGYGAGFYDIFLNKMNRRVDKIALAYQFQVLNEVPMNELDVTIDGIITEEEIILIDKHKFSGLNHKL
ncbi:5-formyltetrahydrofolate cyclo-ligase [Clostridium sp.]|uniref:5-formyltetrahydrofolate cyclo-ligase n=1 Tax=Clostridium sp. TaxID=1506 RepID=UPI001A470278|nr:5-formyltetrahydrofolate cyclo-ligase [Clostridium sp.]MBK5243375.1 5-formyltetrahydrofolate cyclo-ligase [Clostridium sp.]